MCACLGICTQVSMEARRGCRIPCRWLWAALHGSWELNSDPLDEKQVHSAISAIYYYHINSLIYCARVG